MTYHLQVLTPEKIFFDGEVTSLIAPGEDGYFGVLANHASLIASLKDGVLIINDKDKHRSYFHIKDGFFEVHKNQAIVLVETIETSAPVQMGGGI